MPRSVWRKKSELKGAALADIPFQAHRNGPDVLYLQNNARACKGRLSLLTVVDVVLIVGYRAGFGDIPRCSRLRMLRVAHIWCRLVAKGNCKEGNEDAVDEGGQDWGPDVQNVHNALEAC
jgi:hypothetical protein